MPKGAAANLASGGMPPVATLSGKLAALRGARPAASRKSAGSSTVKDVLSASGTPKRTAFTSASPGCAAVPSPSPSKRGSSVS